jgi:hypothetical protein
MSQEDYMFLKLFKVIWEYKIWIWIFCNKINNFFFLVQILIYSILYILIDGTI